MKRYQNLSLRKPELLSANRRKGCRKETVDEHLTNFVDVFAKHPFEPHRIRNQDETGFSKVPTSFKVIAEQGSSVGQYASAECGPLVTMGMAISATNQSIPPFYLLPRKNIKSIFLDNATVGFANGCGWMATADFVKYMLHFIKHTNTSKENPFLFGDG